MARQSNTNINTIGRSKITTPSIEVNQDDGSLLLSLVHGEEINYDFIYSWLTSTDTTGVSSTMVIVEGNNTGNPGTPPSVTLDGGKVISLPMAYQADTSPQSWRVKLPADLSSSATTALTDWTTQPNPGRPVYAFFGVEVADGNQILKPVRGLIEIVYSPTEATATT